MLSGVKLIPLTGSAGDFLLDLDRVVKIGKLFSMYGPLLTEKQQEFVKLYYFDDLSLGEIAEQKEISRQAVYDNLQRSEEALATYEEKLGLLTYYDHLQEEIDKLTALIERIHPEIDQDTAEELETIVARLETYNKGELK